MLRDPSIETAKEEDSDDSINLPDPGEDVISDKDDRLERMRMRIERDRSGPTRENSALLRESASTRAKTRKTPKKTEKEAAKEKLKKDGQIRVGQPDKVPQAERVTEPEKNKDKPGPSPS